MNIEIYWDEQDKQNMGWSWRRLTDDCTGDSSGFADDLPENTPDAMLIEVFKREIGYEHANIMVIR